VYRRSIESRPVRLSESPLPGRIFLFATHLFAFDLSVLAGRSGFHEVAENRCVGGDADAATDEHSHLVRTPILVAVAVRTVHVQHGILLGVGLRTADVVAQFPRPRSDGFDVHLERRLMWCRRHRESVALVEAAAECRTRHAHPLARTESKISRSFEFDVDYVYKATYAYISMQRAHLPEGSNEALMI
jgi:hypothetical protein